MDDQKNLLRYLALSFSSYIKVIRSLESRSRAQHFSRLQIARLSSFSSCFSFSFIFGVGFSQMSAGFSSLGRVKGGRKEKSGDGGLASCVLSYYIYLFFSCILLAFYCCCSSRLALSLSTSALSLAVTALSVLGTYIQLYCLADPNLLFLLLLLSGVLGSSLSFSTVLLCSSVLVILSMQLEQSWFWKIAEAMMLYLVSTSLKVLPSSLILFLNQSTRLWLWLMILSRIIFYLYMLFSEFQYCSLDRSQPDSRPLMRLSYLATRWA